jgi:hypothetical protein
LSGRTWITGGGGLELNIEGRARLCFQSERDTTVDVLGVEAAELGVPVGAGILRCESGTVVGNSDRFHAAIIGGGQKHGIVKQESESRL